MSRSPAGPLGATGTGTTTASACRRASASPPSLQGTSSFAATSRRRSTGRCQTPWRPGRLPAAGASKRIAPGAGQSSAAVVVLYTIARGWASGSAAAAARRAGTAQARSVSANVRGSRAARARTVATLAPARRIEAASASSAIRSPAVPPSETSRMSVRAIGRGLWRGMPSCIAAMVGTLVNVGTILAGTAIGTAVGPRLPDRIQQRVLAGLGMITLAIGIDLALAWGREDTSTSTPLYVLAGILLGGMLGEMLAIERRLEGLGDRVQARLAAEGEHSTVSEGFVTASLLFCVGSLTVVGSIQDGLTGDYELLATKAVLDGFAAVALAATLGWGVGLAAVTVLLIQGGITLGAGLFEDVLVGEALAVLTSAGGVTIIGIALKLLDVKDVKVGNFLPALVIAPALVGLVGLL